MARSILERYKGDYYHKPKKLKLDRKKEQITEVDSSSDSKNSCESEDDKFITLEIPDYMKLKAEDRRWESEPNYTYEGYKYKLIVRPNGLKYNEGYGKCIGIWFRPIPSDLDAMQTWPAKVKFSITVQSFSENSAHFDKDLRIPMQEYTWEKHTTLFRYPAFNFGLSAIKHSTIEKAQCIVEDKLLLTIEEN